MNIEQRELEHRNRNLSPEQMQFIRENGLKKLPDGPEFRMTWHVRTNYEMTEADWISQWCEWELSEDQELDYAPVVPGVEQEPDLAARAWVARQGEK